MKGIYFCFYFRRSYYLYLLQDVCFYFEKKKKRKFCCCYSYNSVKVLEKSWNVNAKSHGKSEKKSWKVLEFESFFKWEP